MFDNKIGTLLFAKIFFSLKNLGTNMTIMPVSAAVSALECVEHGRK